MIWVRNLSLMRVYTNKETKNQSPWTKIDKNHYTKISKKTSVDWIYTNREKLPISSSCLQFNKTVFIQNGRRRINNFKRNTIEIF